MPMIYQEKGPSTARLPSLPDDFKVPVLTVQTHMADWSWSEVFCMVLSSVTALETVTSSKGTVTCTRGGNHIFKWHSWQQREGLLVPLLHWLIFSSWWKAPGQFSCNKNCCSYNMGNNTVSRKSRRDRCVQRLTASWGRAD